MLEICNKKSYNRIYKVYMLYYISKEENVMQTKKILAIALAAAMVGSIATVTSMTAFAGREELDSAEELATYFEDHTVGVVGSITGWGAIDDIAMTDEDGDGVYTAEFRANITDDMLADKEAGTIQFKVRADGAWDDSWGDYDEDYDRVMNSQVNCEMNVTSGESYVIRVTLDSNVGNDDAPGRFWEVDYTFVEDEKSAIAAKLDGDLEDYYLFDNSETQWDSVGAYWWEPEQPADWPGIEATQVEGTDYWAVKHVDGTAHIIFNNLVSDEEYSADNPKIQTPDVVVDPEGAEYGMVYVPDIDTLSGTDSAKEVSGEWVELAGVPEDLPVVEYTAPEVSEDESSDESSDASTDESSDESTDESSDVSTDESSDTSTDTSSDDSKDESKDESTVEIPDKVEFEKLGIVGNFTDWGEKSDIEMIYTEEDGMKAYVGVVTDLAAGDYEFKVRADSDWTHSWGAYEEEFDRTYNSQTNCKFTIEEGEGILYVILDVSEEDFELWPVSYMVMDASGQMTFVNSGKGGEASSIDFNEMLDEMFKEMFGEMSVVEGSSTGTSTGESSKTTTTTTTTTTPATTRTTTTTATTGSTTTATGTVATGDFTVPAAVAGVAAAALGVVVVAAKKKKSDEE